MRKRFHGLFGFAVALVWVAAGCGSASSTGAATGEAGMSASAGNPSVTMPGSQAGSGGTNVSGGSGGSKATGTGGGAVKGTGGGVPRGTGGGTAAGGTVGGTAGMSSGAAPTFSNVYAIITKNCGGSNCHLAAPGAAGLLMSSSAAAYMNLVGASSSKCAGQQRVVAGNPDMSVLVLALQHTRTSTCRAPAMPEGKPMLAQADITLIRDWISAGAMNN